MNSFINIHFEEEDSPDSSTVILKKAGYYEKISNHYIYRHTESGQPNNAQNTPVPWYEDTLSIPYHTTVINEAVFIYCFEGSGWLKSTDTEWKIEKGTVIFCDQNAVHAYGSDANNPWTIIWVHFTGNLVNKLSHFLQCDHSCIAFKPMNDMDFSPHFQRMMTLLQLDAMKHRLLATHYLEIALSELMLHPIPHSFYPSSENNLSQLIKETLMFMNTQLDNQLTLDQLAERVNLSKYYFSRQFKLVTGQAPMTYFNHQKILKASELLRTTSLRILDISSQLGFSSPYYFSETFKHFMNMSPRDYKQKQGIKY